MVKDEILDTEAKKSAAITDFTTLLEHPGWKLLEKIVQANIEIARTKLEEATFDESENEDKLRGRLRGYREVITTPVNQLSFLMPSETEAVNTDPDPFYADKEEIDADEATIDKEDKKV